MRTLSLPRIQIRRTIVALNNNNNKNNNWLLRLNSNNNNNTQCGTPSSSFFHSTAATAAGSSSTKHKKKSSKKDKWSHVETFPLPPPPPPPAPHSSSNDDGKPRSSTNTTTKTIQSFHKPTSIITSATTSAAKHVVSQGTTTSTTTATTQAKSNTTKQQQQPQEHQHAKPAAAAASASFPIITTTTTTNGVVQVLRRKRSFMLDQPRLDFRFSPNAADFHVDEVMRFDHHDDDHEHLVFKASKKGLATWELVKLISSHTGIKAMDIGYAGLKDKKATTSQYISIRKADYAKLKGFISSSISSHQQQQQQQHVVHLEQVGTSRKKIKIGDHDGNRFFVRLWNVDDATASLLDAGLDALRRHGMPNYFGIQRYGRDLDSHIKGKQILESSSSSSWAAGGATGSGNGNGSGSFGGFRDRKLNVMFVEAYQSFLFDCWLSARVELSKLAAKLSSSSSSPSLLRAGLHYWSAQDEEAAVQLMNSLFSPTTTASIATTPLLERLAMQEQFFKLLPGDVLSHYPIGKLFHVVNNENEQVLRESAVRFAKDRAVCPTGLLPGTKQHGSRWPAMHEAREIEKEFDFFASASSSLASAKFFAPESSRRFAWVFPEDIQGAYVRQGQGRNNNKGGCYEMSFYLSKGSYCTTLLDELKHDTSLDAKFHPLKRRRL